MQSIEIKVEQIAKSSSNVGAVDKPDGTQKDKVSAATAAKRVGITTLGCKVNTYESELIGEALKTDNWRLVANTEVADLYLINTCTVTREADRQARQEVRKAVKRNAEALVVVTGCYAQMDADACAAIPGVDLVLGNDRKLDIHQLLPSLQAGKLPKVMVGDLDKHLSLPNQLLSSYESQTRAFVQIQQGCDQGCTFCIIHVARGRSRSLAPSLIKRQVQRLVLNGFPEIVICGVDLGSYGDDFNNDEGSYLAEGSRLAEGSFPEIVICGVDLGSYGDDFNNDEGSYLAEGSHLAEGSEDKDLEAQVSSFEDSPSRFDLVDLLEELLLLEHEPDNPFRIRLSSIDPHHLSDRLLDLMARQPRICPHIHLSLQSGNTLILKRMKRRYSADHVRERIGALRARVPNLVISADVMVGFPTESEAQYLDTEQMLKDIEVAFPHTFSYSEREGTPAAKIPVTKQVPVPERKARNARLRKVGEKIRNKLLQQSLGKEAYVLPERASKRHGYSLCRAEDYLSVLVESSQLEQGRWQKVRYTSLDGDKLVAQACE